MSTVISIEMVTSNSSVTPYTVTETESIAVWHEWGKLSVWWRSGSVSRAKKQCVSSDEARPANGQHCTPCSDCPWARTSLRGWTGSSTPEKFVADAHGETRIECHTLIGAQCAGAAIYRGNVCKSPRDKELLKLPSNRALVFATRFEFLEHHRK